MKVVRSSKPSIRLSILTCFTAQQTEMRAKLGIELSKQIKELGFVNKVEVLCALIRTEDDNKPGRAFLLKQAKGKYVQFLEAYDWPMENYLQLTMDAIFTNPDLISLKGIATPDGNDPKLFEQSINYSRFMENELIDDKTPNYENLPNYNNCLHKFYADRDFSQESTIVFKQADVNEIVILRKRPYLKSLHP
jgi:hypothetical protein